jgi:ubiquinone/menaquinone biosynthesis C-methylase UbiE
MHDPPPTPRGNDAEGRLRRRYGRIAVGYDRRWARYIEASVAETLDRLDQAERRRALDVGCGTGALIERATRASPARFVGVDLSPEMLAAARARLGPRPELVAGSAAALPFRSGAFDLAVSTSALHHWDDPLPALREMERVLRPGGMVAITDWCGDRWLERLRTGILRRHERVHLRVYRSAELAALLAEAGFAEVRVERWRIGWRWSLMTATAVRPGGA